MTKSKVSLVKSLNHKQSVTAALTPIRSELKNKLKSLESIVVKINFVTTKSELPTTPIQAVETFIHFISPFYKGKIIIAEHSSLSDTHFGFKTYGFYNLAKKYPNVEILDLIKDEVANKTINYPHGKITLPLSKTMIKTPFLVSITRPKTHDTVVVTLGIKNVLVGAICGGVSVRERIHQGKDIHSIMVSTAKSVYPDFVLLDGTVGMEGEGPCDGTPIKAGWTIASFDALAADSLATKLMGFDVEDIGYLMMLRENKMGNLYPLDQIEIIGEPPNNLITPFKPHTTYKSQILWK